MTSSATQNRNGKAAPTAAARTTVAVQGARVHNLKNISVEIPRDRLVVVTGLSLGHRYPVLMSAASRLQMEAFWRVANFLLEGAVFVLVGLQLRIVVDQLHTGVPTVALATVVVVGMGSIGRRLAQLLAPFGTQVIGVASHAREGVHGADELPELMPRADAIVLLTPLTETTRGLIGAAELATLRDGALVVNAGRGPVLGQAALLAEVTSGRLRAVLDVTDPEPLPADHPLLTAPNLTVVPHIGSATRTTREKMADMAANNLLAALAGERMPYCANPEVYER